MKKIIIDGANGYVASHFLNDLLTNNYEVIALVRKSADRSSRAKMLEALMDINSDNYQLPRNLKVYDYSLLNSDFGISELDIENIFSKETDYFHFAASLKYDERSKKEILQTNLEGVENSMKVFLKHARHSSRYFFISTAYSCGNISEIFKEQFYPNKEITHYRNYYEQSKSYAENIVKDYIDKHHLKAHILRPSQVVGHHRSGVTKTDYGIFDFAKRIHGLAFRYPNQTLRVKVNPESTQNLIPIDTVVNYLMQITRIPVLPVIMNLTSKNSIKNATIIEILCKLLPINIIPTENLKYSDMTTLEKIISKGMSFTSSYTSTSIEFDRSNLDQVILPEKNQINDVAVTRMLEYFISEISAKKAKKRFLAG